MASNINNYFSQYVSFVIKNPLLASEIEVGLKWASYLVAGRFSQSPVVTEFIHTSSKLLSLVNDNILRKAVGIPTKVSLTVERLQTFLTIIEYSEVFAEVSARQLSGTRGKWLIVILLQIVKFVLRAFLLLKHDQGLYLSPPVPPLNRQKDIPQLVNPNETVVIDSCSSVDVTFSLKTTGRVMRTLDAAPPLVHRKWKLPQLEERANSLLSRHPTTLSGNEMTGEMLYLLKPLVHLASMGAFGKFSWKPWLIAMAMDLSSLRLLRLKRNFTKAEKQELSRRVFCLVLYLLRSPFYDKYSKTRIIGMLRGVSDNVYGSGLLLRPLIEYLPEWQQQYFYTWSS